MQTHNAYVSGNDFKVGSVVALSSKTVQQGDALAIEFLNHASTSGTVSAVSSNELEMQIGPDTWRLRPHAPSDGAVHGDRAAHGASFWTVQTRLDT